MQDSEFHVLPVLAHRFCAIHFCLPVPGHTVQVHFLDASAGHAFIQRSRARPAGGPMGLPGRRAGSRVLAHGQGGFWFGPLPRLPDYVNHTYREQSVAGFLKPLVPCTHETPTLPLNEPINSTCAFRHRKRVLQAGILLPSYKLSFKVKGLFVHERNMVLR